MRSFGLAVLMSLAAACGRSGDGFGFGSTNEGIQNNGVQSNGVVPANGCVVPSSVKWTDPHDALENGTTGDTCSFDGAAGNGKAMDTCVAHRLYIETFTSDPNQSFCSGPGGGLPPSQVLADGCVESCHNSGGAVITCIKQPVQAPSRQIPSAWSMNAQSDCDALFSGCPETGDACTGSTVCIGEWHADQPSNSVSFTIWYTSMWCDNGTLVVGEADY